MNSSKWPQLDGIILQCMPEVPREPISSGILYSRVMERCGDGAPSRDTIARALDQMHADGLIDKQGEARARVWWRTGRPAPSDHARRPPLDLAIALMTLRRHAHHHLPGHISRGLQAYFEGAEKVLGESLVDPLLRQARAWPGKTVRVEVGYPLTSPPVSNEILNAVRHALYTGRVLEVTYRNSRLDTKTPSSYRVVPLGLVERGPVLYVVATRRSHTGPFRYYHLRLDRFVAATCTETPGETDPAFDLDEYVRRSEYFSFFPDGKIRLELRVLEDDNFGHLFREQWLADDQQIIDEPGGFRLQATVMLSVALRNLLMERSARVEVLAPAALRTEIASQLQQAASCYDADRGDAPGPQCPESAV
nr:WYL domain-containing protein [uncultured Cupriavidus sp.]